MPVKVTVEDHLFARTTKIRGFCGELYLGELDAEERTATEYMQKQQPCEDG